MSGLSRHLPQDRVQAVLEGASLPSLTSGTVLFADISGFTHLTEALYEMLGPRRGAEVLTDHLNIVFDALINHVERFGGSVIGFAGDAIICWFDMAGGSTAPRAVACAFALQEAMLAFSAISLPDGATAEMALKVALASGAVRRFVVGDPDVRYIDTLAGTTVARCAVAEQLAVKGDVIADSVTTLACSDLLHIRRWRSAPNGQDRYALVEAASDLYKSLALSSPPSVPDCTDDQIRDWLSKPLLDRTQSFPTEFRPCVAVLIGFAGIDYESDDAENKLDAFIRLIQHFTRRYDGMLLQLIIGDKGSYAYVNLGAISAHEDDARRAIRLALALRGPSESLGYLEPLQIGIAAGTLRVGAYGAKTRRTFDALGDDVNLAARLMQSAKPGEILVSGRVHKATRTAFNFERRSLQQTNAFKRRSEPLPIFSVKGEHQQQPIRLQEPSYPLPIVGRQDELRIARDRLDAALNGSAQVIGIVAGAGLGKSRLAAEIIQVANRCGFACFGGACQSDTVYTPYQAWKTIWQAFFEVDPAAPSVEYFRLLQGKIQQCAPNRLQALPLLGILLNLDIPDNDFTRHLAPEFRQSALHSLLEACLRAAAEEEPILIVVEDLHWIDALSHELLETLAKALVDSPVCFVLAYRPPQLARLAAPRLEALHYFTRIELHELSPKEAEQAVRAKIEMLYPVHSDEAPTNLIEKLIERSQGNPFYLEELINYLHDQTLDPRDPHTIDNVELPDSLHALILSRIDQLGEPEKTTLRAASIIGRLFRVGWLSGYYAELGDPWTVQSHLDQLHKFELTLPDMPEPDPTYIFKHIVTHEVTYGSLPYATRAQLHERLARFLESQVAAGAIAESSVLDALVYHYTHSENQDKQRTYLQRAADAALIVSAFDAARDYLIQLLGRFPQDDPRRPALERQLGDVHSRLGDYVAAQSTLEQALTSATTPADRAATHTLLAQISFQKGEYSAALAILTDAVPMARSSGDKQIVCRALSTLGRVKWRLGDMDGVVQAFEESLALAQATGDLTLELAALNGLGVAYLHSDEERAEFLLTEVLTRGRWRQPRTGNDCPCQPGRAGG